MNTQPTARSWTQSRGSLQPGSTETAARPTTAADGHNRGMSRRIWPQPTRAATAAPDNALFVMNPQMAAGRSRSPYAAASRLEMRTTAGGASFDAI